MSTRELVRLKSTVFTHDDIDVERENHPTVTVCEITKKYLEHHNLSDDEIEKSVLALDYVKCMIFCKLIHSLEFETPEVGTAATDAQELLVMYGSTADRIKRKIKYTAIPENKKVPSYTDRFTTRLKYIRLGFESGKYEVRYWWNVLKSVAESFFHILSAVAFWSVFYFWFAKEAWELATVALLFSLFSAILVHSLESTPLNNTNWLLVRGFTKCALLIYFFARIYEDIGLLRDESVVNDIYSSIYFSIVTWTTLGYGDFSPTEDARIWAVPEAFVGYISTALLVAFFVAKLIDKHNANNV